MGFFSRLMGDAPGDPELERSLRYSSMAEAAAPQLTPDQMTIYELVQFLPWAIGSARAAWAALREFEAHGDRRAAETQPAELDTEVMQAWQSLARQTGAAAPPPGGLINPPPPPPLPPDPRSAEELIQLVDTRLGYPTIELMPTEAIQALYAIARSTADAIWTRLKSGDWGEGEWITKAGVRVHDVILQSEVMLEIRRFVGPMAPPPPPAPTPPPVYDYPQYQPQQPGPQPQYQQAGTQPQAAAPQAPPQQPQSRKGGWNDDVDSLFGGGDSEW